MLNSMALQKGAESSQLDTKMPLVGGKQDANSTGSNYFFHDVLAKVLSLVPLASFTRFQCVNSSWRHLILYDPSLESLRKRLEDHHRVIGFYYTPTNRNEPLHFQPLQQLSIHAFEDAQLDESQRIRATCGAAVLISGMHSYFVRNAVTKTTVKVPSPPLPQVPKLYGLTTTSRKGFEIVCITTSFNSKAFTYSSSSGNSWAPLALMDSTILKLLIGRWPVKDVLIPTLNYLNPVGAAFARESLHWFLKDGRIAVLHIKERTWRDMESPAVGKVDMSCWTMRCCLDLSLRDGEACDCKSHFDSYPNVWFGSMGSYLYLVMVINGNKLQLWMLENYGDKWKKIVDIKGGYSDIDLIKPLLFDGRRIGVASLKDWVTKRSVMRYFDTFNMKWQWQEDDKFRNKNRSRSRVSIDKCSKGVWFYFPCSREE